MADTSANITNQLRDDYLSQFNTNIGNQLNATNAMMKGFGIDLQNYIGNALMKSGALASRPICKVNMTDKAMYDYQLVSAQCIQQLANILAMHRLLDKFCQSVRPNLVACRVLWLATASVQQAYNDYMNYNNNSGGGMWWLLHY